MSAGFSGGHSWRWRRCSQGFGQPCRPQCAADHPPTADRCGERPGSHLIELLNGQTAIEKQWVIERMAQAKDPQCVAPIVALVRSDPDAYFGDETEMDFAAGAIAGADAPESVHALIDLLDTVS